MADGIHLTEKGNARLNELINEILKQKSLFRWFLFVKMLEYYIYYINKSVI